MFNYSKDGVVVSTVLGARTINKEGKYPVKIKGYYQKRPKYDSIGICMTKEEWNKLPGSKSFEYRKIKQAIESCFSLVRMKHWQKREYSLSIRLIYVWERQPETL